MTNLLHSPQHIGCHSKPTPELLQQLGQWVLCSDMALAIFAPDDTLYFASASFCQLYQIPPGRQSFDTLMRHCFENKVGPRLDAIDIDNWLSQTKDRRRVSNRRTFEADFLDGRWMLMVETVRDDGWLFLFGPRISPLSKHKSNRCDWHVIRLSKRPRRTF